MQFNWEHLKYFLAVARLKKLTVAARRLNTDHTTVSRRIRELETSLEANLFERSPRGYALTPEGERLLQRAEQMERIAAFAQNEVGGTKSLLTGTVRIGAPDGFGAYFLAPRIAELSAIHPNLELQIVPVPMTFSITKREADIAIAMRQPTEGRLVSRLLTKYTLHLYASENYLSTYPPIHSLDDVVNHNLISHISDLMFAPEQDYLPALSARARPSLTISSSVAQLRATLSGSGLCILADFMAQCETGLVRILPEEAVTQRELWLITSADFQEIARIRAVIDFIVGMVRRERHLFLPLN